jgi:CRISPR/Cas system CSM-associated protein Csm4 (group 5 of RAMP superfamily)
MDLQPKNFNKSKFRVTSLLFIIQKHWLLKKWIVDLTNGKLIGTIQKNFPGIQTLYTNESGENAVRIQLEK